MLLFWALLIVPQRWLATGSGRRPPSPDQSALDILAQRYARGEIDRTEFELKRHDLGGA